MCEPTTLALAAAAVVSTAVTAYSAQTQKAAGEYQAGLQIQQAKQAEKQAASERQEGIEEARSQRLQAILNMGEEKTAIAAGNISTNSATAINIINDAELNGELEALTTLRSSERSAQNYLYQADQYYAQAGLTSFKTKAQYTSSMLNVLGSSTKTIGSL